MKVYEVKALDIKENRVITFNHNITKTFDDAVKFARNLVANCSDGYSNVSVCVSEYKLISTDVYNVDSSRNIKKVGK